MTFRSTRMLLALVAIVALAGALAGGAVAGKPQNPGSQGKGKKQGKTGIKPGVSKPKGGTTVLTIDAGVLAALTGAGVTPNAVDPATLSGADATFPITKGRIVYKKAKSKGKTKKLLSGYVNHSGSLTLTKDTTVVTLATPRVNFSSGRSGSLSVKVGTSSLRIATLSGVAVNSTNKQVTATAKLTKAATDALNAAFGTTVTPGTELGKLTVTPTF